jgi:hypothetical protein
LVGARRFEPPPWSRTRCSTKALFPSLLSTSSIRRPSRTLRFADCGSTAAQLEGDVFHESPSQPITKVVFGKLRFDANLFRRDFRNVGSALVIRQKFSSTAGARLVKRTVLVAAEFHSDVSFGLSGGSGRNEEIGSGFVEESATETIRSEGSGQTTFELTMSAASPH